MRETPCPHCGTVFRGAFSIRAVNSAGSATGTRRHIRECARRDPVDRAYFRVHRRWPRRADGHSRRLPAR